MKKFLLSLTVISICSINGMELQQTTDPNSSTNTQTIEQIAIVQDLANNDLITPTTDVTANDIDLIETDTDNSLDNGSDLLSFEQDINNEIGFDQMVTVANDYWNKIQSTILNEWENITTKFNDLNQYFSSILAIERQTIKGQQVLAEIEKNLKSRNIKSDDKRFIAYKRCIETAKKSNTQTLNLITKAKKDFLASIEKIKLYSQRIKKSNDVTTKRSQRVFQKIEKLLENK
jgi:hypothetical protein